MAHQSSSAPRPSLADAFVPGRGVPAPAELVRDARGLTHGAYRTARRAFCGIVAVERAGKIAEPGCGTCRDALARLEDAGMVGTARAGPRHCGARTRRGLPCGRAPLPCGYCHSHRHLAT